MSNLGRKIKIMQQVLNPIGIGGVSAEYNSLKQSDLNSKYEFIPLILDKCQKGINLRDIKFYYKEIKNVQPDIIHVRGAAVDGLNAIIAAKLAGGCKVLLTVHGMYSDMIYISKIKKILAQFVIEPISFKLSDGISCVCSNANNRSKFLKYRNKMLPFVYNRAPKWEKYDKKEVRNNTRTELHVSKDDIIGIYCGRITREKGIEYLVNALEKIENKNWNQKFKVLIVGDGSELGFIKSRLSKQIQEGKVICTGAKREVYKYILASDFFIQPSLHENHSIALIEASIGEIPSIATRVGGNTEIIFDKKNGILIEPFNVDDIFNAISIMINNKEFRIRAGKLAKEEALKRFNDTIVDNQLDTVYQCLYNKE